ncbi:MAG: ATP-binding cassette domain-containing protein [Candidatus Levybacteria bacterium]|nr:ATP-binding cassette domain-containing protein [Candidatus Levybacteria bacterium]
MISLENVSKKFGTGVFAVSDISFSVERGEFLFLVGPTGSGKTTIFRLLIREMVPTEGSVVVNSWDLTKLPSKKVPELRKKIGVVFQDLKLLADRTVLENTILPLEVIGVKAKEAIARAEEVLKQVGILEHKDKFPVQLSGGELQRAAIARALVLSPDILLADEPTGNLDDDTSWEIVKLLSEINARGTTVLMATHDTDIVKRLNKRIIELKAGSIVHDKGSKVKHHTPSEEHEKKPVSAPSDAEAMDDKKSSTEQAEDDKDKESAQNKNHDKIKTDDFEDALKEEKE